MTPKQPIEITPVANGYILFPSRDNSALTSYKDMYVFRSLYDLTAFLEAHFEAGAPLAEGGDK